MTSLYMYVIYDHPSDFTNDFIVRRFEVTKEGSKPDINIFMNRNDLEDIRVQLKAQGLIPITRDADDDPVIIETWL